MVEAVKEKKTKKKETVTVELPKIARAEAKQVRISPRKVDRVITLIRGKKATEAMTILQFMAQPCSKDIQKVLKSAMTNAEKNHGLNKELLVVKTAVANKGVTLKRFRAGGKGRAQKILKYASHIVIVLEEKGARN